MAFVKVSECLTNPRQLVRLILLVICICITIYQLSGCANKLLYPPITSYYKFRYNKTIKYPALTICRRPSYKFALFPTYGVRSAVRDLAAKDVFQNFSFESYTIEQFLNATTYGLSESIMLYGYRGLALGNNVEFKKSFYPERGLCHTIIPKETANTFSLDTGFWLYLYSNDTNKTIAANGLSTTGYEIHVHNENDVVREERNALKTDFIYLESAENMRVTLTVESFSVVPTDEQPCLKDADYSKSKCEEKCFHNSVVKVLGCTIPWFRDLDQEYDQCNSSATMNQISNLTSSYMREKSLEKCYCPVACNNTIYKYQIESRRDADKIQESSSTISIYFASNLVTELSEVVSYDWNAFLADVGGSLGFLLGLSVIGFVNVIEEVVKLAFRIKKPKEEKVLTDDQKMPRPSTISTNISDVDGESLDSVMDFVVNSDNNLYFQEENEVQEKINDENKF